MKSNISADDKYKEMTEAPVEKLICKLAVPTIITMMISAIYNMADTYFVGKIGTSATAAVGVCFAVMAIVQALGFTFGMGAGNYISRMLGQKRREDAEVMAATSFFSVLILGVIMAASAMIFINPLVRLLGSTETIAPYAKSYLRWILIGAPYMAAAFTLNNIFRLQGSAFYGMMGMTAGGVLNMILDPIFIFVFDFGVAGAAIATIISQAISFLILFRNTRIGGNLPVKLKNFKPSAFLYKEILRGGLPSFYRQVLASVAVVSLNLCARAYGDAAIAAMSIVGRVFQFVGSVILGFGQGFQPVCGFNYGAQKYDRVYKAFWFCLKGSTLFLTIAAIGGFIFAPDIIAIFRKGDPQVIAIGSRALRMQCVTIPLAAWIIMNNMLMQTIGKSLQASLLALSRQGLFYLPIIFLLSGVLGLTGVQMSQAVADALSFAFSIPLCAGALKELQNQTRAISTPGELALK